MEALDTDHAVKNVLSLQLPFIRLRVDLAVGQHALGPELERISLTVETLQLWTERMLANGQIDAETYKRKLEG